MKMNRMIRLLAAMIFTSVIALASPLILTLQNPLLSGGFGDTLTFVAIGINTTALTQDLNADSFTVQSPLTLDDALYLNVWPLQLTDSEAFGPQGLFTIFIPLSTSLGLYNGNFDILGGPGTNDQTVLATAGFQVNVISGPVTPEPATGLLFLSGGVLISLRYRYHR